MENHPIPQDVTGFKFRLIGSMTVKQFSYLLSGGIMSYVINATDIIDPVKYLIIVCIMLFAAALAFVPIDGRPIDKMVFLFVRAIPRENEYIFKKRGARIFTELKEIAPILKHPIRTKVDTKSQDRTKKTLLFNKLHSTLSLDETETNFLNKIKPFFEESVLENKEIMYQNPKDEKKEKQEQKEDRKISFFKPFFHADKKEDHEEKQTAAEKMLGTQDKGKAVEKQESIAKVEEKKAIHEEESKNNEELRRRLLEFVHKRNTQKAPQVTEQPQKVSQQPPPQVTKPTSLQDAATKAGFPILPDVPNVVMGIVKDPRGKILPNIIVEVIDKNNNPVRAFKTNALGQFVSATTLMNGTYKVAFEDPQKHHEFDTIEITLNGKDIFLPLEIISTDAREKLRRELFEN